MMMPGGEKIVTISSQTGLGDSKTKFASTALFEWYEFRRRSKGKNRCVRREMFATLAADAFLDPVMALQIIAQKINEGRTKPSQKTHVAPYFANRRHSTL
jgi:hypothetical protein